MLTLRKLNITIRYQLHLLYIPVEKKSNLLLYQWRGTHRDSLSFLRNGTQLSSARTSGGGRGFIPLWGELLKKKGKLIAHMSDLEGSHTIFLTSIFTSTHLLQLRRHSGEG
jgi:hypothetical protein